MLLFPINNFERKYAKITFELLAYEIKEIWCLEKVLMVPIILLPQIFLSKNLKIKTSGGHCFRICMEVLSLSSQDLQISLASPGDNLACYDL